VTDYEAFFARRIERLRSERGWLSLVDKVVLFPGKNDVAGLGTLTLADGVVSLDGKVLRTDANKDWDRLEREGRLFEIMERGDTFAVRVRDLRELPRPFAGIDRFPVDPTWRKTTRFTKHDTPHRIAIDFEGPGGATDEMECPGILAFEHDGKTIEIDALLEGTRLYIPFRDATSGDESYGTGRFVYAPLPDASCEVVVDFNESMLPGCAFTIHATCPLPPPRNRMKIAVRAGEKNYLGSPVGSA
jgi:uncharacterized protein (DUF1684 family)